MHETRPNGHRRPLDVVKGTGWGISGLFIALIVALGIPLAWVWIASQIAGSKRDLTPSLAILITVGILVSYLLALVAGGSLRRRWVSEDEQRARVRRMSWNRSFRDEPRPHDEENDPVERVFVIVAVLGIVAFEVWFFFFAGSPLPSQPAL
jgi:amino acid transporter